MAREIDRGTVELVRAERTWRVQIFCDQGEDPRIEALREEIRTLPDGTIIGRTANIVTSRHLSQVAEQSVDGVTGAQMADLIAKFADKWRAEDIEAARVAAEEQAAQRAAAEEAERVKTEAEAAAKVLAKKK